MYEIIIFGRDGGMDGKLRNSLEDRDRFLLQYCVKRYYVTSALCTMCYFLKKSAFNDLKKV